MTFVPGFSIGDEVHNNDIVAEFKCSNMGGMRRSKKTNTLVIISDHTKKLYDDQWRGDVLHYTGMGKSGNQDIDFMQNKTLAESKFNGVTVHLFEVLKPKKYTYKGVVELCGQPYQEVQKGQDDRSRSVWMFLIRIKS